MFECGCHAVDFGCLYADAAGLVPPGSDSLADFVGNSASVLVVDSEMRGDLQGKFKRCGRILIVYRQA